MGLRETSEISLQCLWLAVLGVVSTPAIALAHGVYIQSKTTSAVEIQATYDSGEPMAGAQVQVYAPENPENALFSGTTDAQGRYLIAPAIGSLPCVRPDMETSL